MAKALKKGKQWWKFSNYKYEESKEGIILILPTENSIGKWINPLDHLNNNPNTQPEAPNNNYAPHIDLQNLDLDSNKNILEYVNKWGLFGLWDVPPYKKRKIIEYNDKGLSKKGALSNEQHSLWYEYEEYKNKNYIYRKWFCEPLLLWKEAATKIQDLSKMILDAKSNKDNIFEIMTLFDLKSINPTPYFNEKKNEWEFGWEYSNLYHAIYLMIYLDLVEGAKYEVCQNESCKQIFKSTNNKRIYCSTNCENAQTTRVTRKRKNLAQEIYKNKYLDSKLPSYQIIPKIQEELKKTLPGKANYNSVEKWIYEVKNKKS